MTFIKDCLDAYATQMTKLGYKFKSSETILRAFVNFLGDGATLDKLTAENCSRFLYARSEKIRPTWFNQHTALKGFFRWMHARNLINTNLLPTELPRRPKPRKAYIYSCEELKRIFAAALTYQKLKRTIIPECVQMILMLCYLLGLRRSEVLKLRVGDVDSANRIVFVRATKFNKSRILTYNDQVATLIEHFIKWRNEFGLPNEPDSYFFLTRRWQPMNISCFDYTFRNVCEKAGFSRRDGETANARIHDLRHTFAVHRLIQCYRQGQSVQKFLPALSAYMGHKCISHTSVYLTLTPELLSEANSLFENFAQRKEHDNGTDK